MQNALVEKLNQARLLKRHFKLDETVDVLKECLELDPSCLIAAAQAGLCLLMLGKPTEAKPFLKKTFEESQQKDLLVGSYLAACLTALGKENQANEILSDIQNDEFSIAETYMLTAEMMCEKKQYEDGFPSENDRITTLNRAKKGCNTRTFQKVTHPRTDLDQVRSTSEF